MFLVVDNEPSNNLLVALESQLEIDSLFVYLSTFNNTELEKIHIVNRCNNEEDLVNAIRESRQGLEKQTAAFSLYNQKEKSTRDLSKETGSFLFFQLFKTVLMNIELKQTQIDLLKLYRGLKLSHNEIINFEENLGNLFSTNGYLSTTRLYSVAYRFAKKPTNREGIVSVFFQ